MNELAEYFRSQADWRRSVAERYPDDPRNLQSAAALESLAEYVQEDETGQVAAGAVVDRLTPFLVESMFGGEETARELSRYGYGYNATHPAQHEEFLEELVALCLADAYEFAKDSDGADPTETLFPFERDAARDGVHVPQRYFELRSRSLEHELEEVVASYRGDD